jgi:hypothetical protein
LRKPRTIFDASQAFQICTHLSETTIKQFPGKEAWLVREWLPERLEESILQYPDDNPREQTEELIDQLRAFEDIQATELIQRLRRFWTTGTIDYEGLRAAGIAI